MAQALSALLSALHDPGISVENLPARVFDVAVALEVAAAPGLTTAGALRLLSLQPVAQRAAHHARAMAHPPAQARRVGRTALALSTAEPELVRVLRARPDLADLGARLRAAPHAPLRVLGLGWPDVTPEALHHLATVEGAEPVLAAVLQHAQGTAEITRLLLERLGSALAPLLNSWALSGIGTCRSGDPDPDPEQSPRARALRYDLARVRGVPAPGAAWRERDTTTAEHLALLLADAPHLDLEGRDTLLELNTRTVTRALLQRSDLDEPTAGLVLDNPPRDPTWGARLAEGSVSLFAWLLLHTPRDPAWPPGLRVRAARALRGPRHQRAALIALRDLLQALLCHPERTVRLGALALAGAAGPPDAPPRHPELA